MTANELPCCKLRGISPPLTGGDEGEGVRLLRTPPPSPSPIKGEGVIRDPDAKHRGILLIKIDLYVYIYNHKLMRWDY